MAGNCCRGEGCRFAPRLSGAAASLLPGAALLLLPKCPLCLAAWLTVVTGAGISAAGAGFVRGLVLVFWVAGVMLAARQIIRRRRRVRVRN